MKFFNPLSCLVDQAYTRLTGLPPPQVCTSCPLGCRWLTGGVLAPPNRRAPLPCRWWERRSPGRYDPCRPRFGGCCCSCYCKRPLRPRFTWISTPASSPSILPPCSRSAVRFGSTFVWNGAAVLVDLQLPLPHGWHRRDHLFHPLCESHMLRSCS